MIFKKIFVLAFISTLFLPIFVASANNDDFYFQDKINEGQALFFLINLDKGDKIEIDLEADNEGYFVLFLFDKRPEKSNIEADNSLNEDIYENAVTYDKGNKDHVNYTAEEELIYYIEVALLKKGPDTFTLTSNKNLSRYYLPAIPGYDLLSLSVALLCTSIISILLIKRKTQKK